MILDLAVLAVLALGAIAGAASGALRQLVSLLAVVAGAAAVRAFSLPVGDGLARRLGAVGRPVAPALLFLGTLVLVSLVGRAVLGGTAAARAVRAPADRGAGALLGGAKAAVVCWALLSALALAGDLVPAALAAQRDASDFALVARVHNLVVSLDPGAARRLERALEVARRARDEGRLDADAARLLERVDGGPAGAAGRKGREVERADAARALAADPELRAAVERLAGRARDGAGGR